MPVTLCFIKDKHKVMEHKIPLETYFAGLLQKVEWQIQEYEDTAADTLTLCRLCVDYLQEILGELKNFIISYPFASTEEEIHFFKELKPLLASKIIYYNTVYKIEVRFPRSEEHTSELQSRPHLVCRLLLEKKNIDKHWNMNKHTPI